jgi:5-hydroxyisourate hydrolase
MGKLTTHVLDTARGLPCSQVEVRLYRAGPKGYELVNQALTNRDGRCDAPLLEGSALVAGRYRLCFAAGAYFRRNGIALADPPFVDEVTIDFGIADATAQYHVPLLVSPWSYATYRGS